MERTAPAIRLPGSREIGWLKRASAAAGRHLMAIRLTLRVKGVLAVLVLIAYLVLIGVIVAHQRAGLVSIVEELDGNQATLGLLEPTIDGLARTLVDTQQILNSLEGVQTGSAAPSDTILQQPGPHLEQLNFALERLRMALPALDEPVGKFRRAAGSVLARPSAHHLAQMRDSAQVLLVQLQDVMRSLQKDSAELAKGYHAKQQFLSVFAIGANVLGAVASVAVILVFFTRLANDIHRLQNRATAIVTGYDGPPLLNTRSDEVGGLIDAVNRMQFDLRHWERQQELTRQQRFHQEKMAAVGSVASAIGHEVRNPIAAICGVAQFIADESAADERPRGRQIQEFARQILGQTERISHILRQLAALTTPHSPEPELLDVNALVRSTCGFIRYDKRFNKVRFEESLDPELPAATAVSDHITQILMNLLINAADAFDGVSAGEGCAIRVATGVVGDEVVVTVVDNGRGMTPAVLAKAFEESFTTKPPGQGRGIGLFVCKSLIEQSGGRIELTSILGEGTTATVRIPRSQAPG